MQPTPACLLPARGRSHAPWRQEGGAAPCEESRHDGGGERGGGAPGRGRSGGRAGGGGTGGGGSTSTVAFANDLALNGTNQLLFQKSNNDTDLISNESGAKYLKTGSSTAAPAFATISTDDLSEGTKKFFTNTY